MTMVRVTASILMRSCHVPPLDQGRHVNHGADGNAKLVQLHPDVVRQPARAGLNEPGGHRPAHIRGRTEDRSGAFHEANAGVVEEHRDHDVGLGGGGDAAGEPPPPGGVASDSPAPG
jgi:hypothetical protein